MSGRPDQGLVSLHGERRVGTHDGGFGRFTLMAGIVVCVFRGLNRSTYLEGHGHRSIFVKEKQ
jgi:hypothetical protein